MGLLLAVVGAGHPAQGNAQSIAQADITVSGREPAATANGVSGVENGREERPPPRIRIGFYTIEGRPRYSARSESESGVISVRFSSVRTGGRGVAATIPSGLPVSGHPLTSGFGYRVDPLHGRSSFHSGVDLAVPAGTPVAATQSGHVSRAGWVGNYGYLVEIAHGDGLHTRYAHLSDVHVGVGDQVDAGDVIGLSGATGRATGPHVHYEVRVDGRPVDPLSD